jgi:uncharacterized protein YuzE
MRDAYLQITYRNGRAFAAYLYLSRKVGDKSHRTREFPRGLVADIAKDGRVIGIEIITPAAVTVSALNRALRALGLEPMKREHLAPLSAA